MDKDFLMLFFLSPQATIRWAKRLNWLTSLAFLFKVGFDIFRKVTFYLSKKLTVWNVGKMILLFSFV